MYKILQRSFIMFIFFLTVVFYRLFLLWYIHSTLLWGMHFCFIIVWVRIMFHIAKSKAKQILTAFFKKVHFPFSWAEQNTFYSSCPWGSLIFASSQIRSTYWLQLSRIMFVIYFTKFIQMLLKPCRKLKVLRVFRPKYIHFVNA